MRHAGFSLIELLVVLVIVGIATAAVTLSLRGGESRAVQQEAERLRGLLELACERAELVGRPVALQLDRSGWRFGWLESDGLRAMEARSDEPLRPRAWQPGLDVALAEQPLPDMAERPQILCAPDGRPSPFVLRLRTRDGAGTVRLRADEDGALRIEADDAR